jgi:protein EFR3
LLLLQVDPHLCIADDYRLICTSAQSSNSEMAYGSEEDESEAQAFLSAISKDDTELMEIAISCCKEKFKILPEVWIQISLVFFYVFVQNQDRN